LEKAGIGCGVHYIPVYRFSYYRKIPGFTFRNYPHCEDTFRRVISLPFYPGLKVDQVDYIGSTLEKLARKFTR
jgi:dTDP-4-amino-4,6-dideoxygalactose transaminase